MYGLARALQGRRSGSAMFVAGATAAVLLHEFAVLGPLAALGVAAVLRRLRVSAALRLAALPCTCLLAVAAASVGQRAQISWLDGMSFGDARAVLVGPFGHLFPPAALTALLTALLGLLVLRRVITAPLLIPAVWAVVPPTFLIGLSVVTPVYLLRYTTASAPAVGLFVAAALAAAAGHRLAVRRVGAGLAMTVVGIMAGASVFTALFPVTTGSTAAAQACAVADTVALPASASRATLQTLLPADGGRWPVTTAGRSLRTMDLDVSQAAFDAAGTTVAVCTSGDTEPVARFEQRLIDEGWRQQREQSFERWVVATWVRDGARP